MGAGAVGCFVGGKLASLGIDTVFVGRERLKREIDEHGLVLEDLGAPTTTIPKEKVVFVTEVASLADRDIVLCCVKSAGTAEAGERMAGILPRDAIVISLQNGVRNPDELRKQMRQRVLAGIVNFNVLAKGGGVFRRATTGPLAIEACADRRPTELGADLERAAFEVEHVAPHKMRALQWAKLLLNLNNAIGALSDRPTKEIVLTAGYRRALAATISESLHVLRAAGIKPARLGTLPPWVIAVLLRLPTPLVRVATRTQLKIDPEARSSMWQDLTNGRPTEVDWLNGEVVQLADACGAQAPLNRRIVELVHEAERAGVGSPRLTAEDLWRRLRPRA
jgi:2-dehydropantoate 2-reductase